MAGSVRAPCQKVSEGKEPVQAQGPVTDLATYSTSARWLPSQGAPTLLEGAFSAAPASIPRAVQARASAGAAGGSRSWTAHCPPNCDQDQEEEEAAFKQDSEMKS